MLSVLIEQPNQNLQQMKLPVTSIADASAAPHVFTAEARCSH